MGQRAIVTAPSNCCILVGIHVLPLRHIHRRSTLGIFLQNALQDIVRNKELVFQVFGRL